MVLMRTTKVFNNIFLLVYGKKYVIMKKTTITEKMLMKVIIDGRPTNNLIKFY